VLGSALHAVSGPRKPGRIKGKYAPKDAMPPFERLFSLLGAASFQRPGITIEFLARTACQLTDLQAADRFHRARAALFNATSRCSA
jgi:hypothetical protein